MWADETQGSESARVRVQTRRRPHSAFVALMTVVAASLTVVAAPAGASASGVSAWGSNYAGELGQGTHIGPNRCMATESCSATPVSVHGLGSARAVAAGVGFGLALMHTGYGSFVEAWGENGEGQLGDGSTAESDVPVRVQTLTNVKSIAAAGSFALASLRDGTVRAWGDNSSWQLGNGTNIDSSVPVAVTGLGGVRAVAAGAGFGLALLKNGTVMSWGSNRYGQLGDGKSESEQPYSAVPVEVSGLRGVTAIAARGAHALALFGNGTVTSWGANERGEVGDDTHENRDAPVPVPELTGVRALAAGSDFSLALLENGKVMAWGDDLDGELGFEIGGGCGYASACALKPVEVPGLTGVTAIAAGGANSLALLGNGTVMAWGAASFGALGNGRYTWPRRYRYGPDEPNPVAVCGLARVKGITAGSGFAFAYGGTRTGCPKPPWVLRFVPWWGGATGDCTTIVGDNLETVTSVKIGEHTSPRLWKHPDGSLTAEIPEGPLHEYVPLTVSNPEGTSLLPEGYGSYEHFFEFTHSGESCGPVVKNVSLHNGRPTAPPGSAVTITGSGFTDATAVRFGHKHAESFTVESGTAITAVSPPGTGTVDVTVTGFAGTSPTGPADEYTYSSPSSEPYTGTAAWGSNYRGELGDGTETNSATPVAVKGLSEVASVAVGGEFSLALLRNGTVMGWGSDERGQLGDDAHFGAEGAIKVPRPVPGLSEVVAIAAGEYTAFALLKNGTVVGWGENVLGLLGPSAGPEEVKPPTPISGLSNVTAISLGFHADALLSNGTVMAWGSNRDGQLGDGKTEEQQESSAVPVRVSGLTGVTQISTAGEHTLALLENGTAVAWGNDHDGQLGNGTSTDSDVPVPVSGLSGLKAVSAGADDSFALLEDDTVMGWGYEGTGNLGDGSSSGPELCPEEPEGHRCSRKPVPVSGLSDVSAISAAGSTALALLGNGTVMTWGLNVPGNVPVPVEELTGVAGIAAGPRHDLAFFGP
jgi:alpha-tubulin suppressor-like RCC1 family protein